MRHKWTATFALLAVALARQAVVPLGRTLPVELPSTAGWERIDGELEIARPRTRVQYEFFVNPRRQGAYEVVRYRVTPLAGDAGEVTEKVQWDRDGRDVRRWECAVPADAAACQWTEMAKGSPEYRGEVPVIIWIYALHRQVLLGRSPR